MSRKRLSVLLLFLVISFLNSSSAFAIDMKAGGQVPYKLTITNVGEVNLQNIHGTASIYGNYSSGRFTISPTSFTIPQISSGGSYLKTFQVKAPPQPNPKYPIILYGYTTFKITSAMSGGKSVPVLGGPGYDLISADPTFIQPTLKDVITAGGSPYDCYISYGYLSPAEIIVEPSDPQNVSIYAATSTDQDAQITIPEDALTEDTVVTINNTDSFGNNFQIKKAQFDLSQNAYNQGIRNTINTTFSIDTQAYIDEAVGRGMNEQTVTNYINNTIADAQNNLSVTVDDLIASTFTDLLPTLQSVNTQVADEVNDVVDDTLTKEGQFAQDKGAATQKAEAENSVADLITQLQANGASQNAIDQIQQDAKVKAETQAAIAISKLEATKFNDVKTLHDEANLLIQNLIFDTNKTIISQNNSLRQEILEEKDISQSDTEKDIITYIRGTTDTVLPTASISSPTENQSLSGTVNIIGTASDDNIKEFTLAYFDGTNWNTINSSTTSVTNSTLGTWNTNTVANGNYPLKLRVVDNAGNVSRVNLNVVIDNQDTTAPVINISSPAQNEEIAGVVTITGLVTETYLSNYIIEYATESQPANWIQIGSNHKLVDPSGILAQFNPLLLPKGNHVLRVTATDADNNSSSASVTVFTGHNLNNSGGHIYAANALVDDQRLLFAYKSFNIKPKDLTLNQPATIKLHYTDQELTDSGYEENLLRIFLYNEETDTWALIPTQIDSENNNLTADITKLGVYCIKEYKPDLVDTTPPTAEITTCAYNSSTNLVTISGTANDENLDSYLVEYTEDAELSDWIRVENSPKIVVSNTLAIFDAKDLLPGNYAIRLTVFDQAGNSSQSSSNVTIGQDKIINLATSDPYIAPEVDSDYVAKQATITYQLLQDSDITVKIKDGVTDVITLLSNQPQTAGTQTLTWDGKDANNQYVPTKTYTIEVTSSLGTQATVPIEVKDLIAKISVPHENSLVRGKVPIFGLACGKDFREYTVEYGQGTDPQTWTQINTSQVPQTVDVDISEIASADIIFQGNLATWEVGLTEYSYGYWSVNLNGIYTVRLTATSNTDKTEVCKVTVEVGRVISNIYGGTAASSDNKVKVIVPEQAIKDDFELISILAISNQTVSIATGYTLVGNIYKIEPPGEKFTKDAILEMNYTNNDLGTLDENKLGIYAYNPLTLQWDYLATNRDLVNNKLTTSVTEISWPYAYYAILAKTIAPNKPVLYDLSTATAQLKLVTISGYAERGSTVEIFVNGTSRGTTTADKDTGYFSLANVLLDPGTNVITAVARDAFEQTSQTSDAVTREYTETAPTNITSVSFKDSSYSQDYAGSAYLEDTLYIQVVATDADPATVDATQVKVTSSISDTTGITVQLFETDYNSGVYRGVAYVSQASSLSEKKIAAQANGETIKAEAVIDNTKFDTLNVADQIPPQSPTVTSSTHPSVCQDTFENGFDQWSNRDGAVGAVLYLNNTQTTDGTNCLELVNPQDNGNFASNVRTAQFDVKQYPLVSFDYAIAEDVRINLLVKVDDYWYDIVFTDNPKQYWDINMKKIGDIQNVTADSLWHSATFNLYEMLKGKTDSTVIQEMVMADWDDRGFMKLVYGSNSSGATYYIDNFRISKAGIDNSSPQFTITATDPSGIAGYSYILDQVPDTIPDTTVDGTQSVVNYTGIADGTWYFHVRAEDNAGNWSAGNHYKIFIDTQGPTADTPTPQPYDSSGNPTVTLHLTDGQGCGVDPETIKLEVEGTTYDLTSPALSYNKQTETLTFVPANIGLVVPDKQTVDVQLTEAKDYAGNLLQAPLSWEWTLDYSLDAIPPDAPVVTSYLTPSPEHNQLNINWISTDANGIAGYSFVLDQTPDTIPDTTSEGLITSKIYSDLDNSWYFHVRASDRAGNWGDASHYQVDIQQYPALLIDDFNDGNLQNSFGWTYSWSGNGATSTANPYNTDLNNIYGQSGYSLEFNYDVPSGGWGGFTTEARTDMSDYNYLTFWVKGLNGGEKFKVGLKDSGANGIPDDSDDNETRIWIMNYLPNGVTTSWQKVSIPLSSFVDVHYLSTLNNFSIAIESPYLGTGTVYVENIQFEKHPGLLADDFNDGSLANPYGWTYSWQAPNATSQVSIYNTDINNVYGGYGNSLKFNYDVPAGSWGGFTTEIRTDLSSCNALSFYVKGSSGGEKFKVGLKDSGANGIPDDSDDNETKIWITGYLPNGATAYWQKVIIPFSAFGNIQHWDKMNNFTVTVENPNAGTGIVYFENIEFINQISPTLLDNFNDGNLSNPSGWTYSWNGNGGTSSVVPYNTDTNNVYGGSGYSLEFTYNVPGEGYGGFTSDITGDVSGYNALSFYIKGASGGEKFKVGLKDSSGHEAKVYVTDYLPEGVTTSWKKVVIPLSAFSGVQFSSMNSFSVTVEDPYPGSGIVYIDEIKFINVEYVSAPVISSIASITNQGSLTITGQAQPGVEIIPFVEITGGAATEQTHTTADSQGNFTAQVSLCANNSNQIYAYAKDSQENISLYSSKQTIFYDNIAPTTPTMNSITSPTRDPDIFVSGSAETGTTVHLVVTRPNSGDVEYTQEASYGAYGFNITLSDGDGAYQLAVKAQDDAGNWSGQSSPTQVVLDAVSLAPVVTLNAPKEKDVLGYGTYDVKWQAVDPDPTDTISDITIKYSNPATNQVLVDNFNSQSATNNLGGSTDVWTANGATISASFVDAGSAYDYTGHSRQLTYDVTAADSHAGYWSSLVPQPDMSGYQYLALEVKGASGAELFKVGLKDSSAHETKLLITGYLSSGVTAKWQKANIPLADFTGVDLANLENVSITFENWIPSGSGTIYLDEIRFIKWQNLTTGEANDGIYPWNTLGLPESDRYLLKTQATDDRNQQGQAEIKDYFTISGLIFDNFNGQAVVEGWWDSDGTTVYQRSFDDTTSYEGTHSMKVIYNKNNYPWSFFAAYPVHDGVKNNYTKYNQFIFYIKGNASIQLRLEDVNHNGWEQTQSTQTQAEDDWEKLTYDFSGEAGVNLANIDNVMFFVAPGNSTATGTIWIDTIHLATNYTNLAINKTATSSADYSANYPASKVVDGQIDESSISYWLLPDATTGWVKIDLGADYNINRIKWLNTHNGTSNNRATTNWRVQTSEDDSTYTQVGTGTETFSSNPNWVDAAFSYRKARYIKLYVDGYYNLGGGINELQVYGY